MTDVALSTAAQGHTRGLTPEQAQQLSAAMRANPDATYAALATACNVGVATVWGRIQALRAGRVRKPAIGNAGVFRVFQCCGVEVVGTWAGPALCSMCRARAALGHDAPVLEAA